MLLVKTLLMTLAMAPAQAGPAYTEPDVAPAYSVQTVCDMPDGTAELGSGSVVAHTPDRFRVLTCAHCVPAAGKPSVVFRGRRLPARVLRSNPARDLALLEVEGRPEGLTAAKVAGSEAWAAGSEVFWVGYPFGRARVVAAAVRADTQQDGRHHDWKSYRLTVSPLSGHSGAGVFRKGDGELIGVLHSRLVGGVGGAAVTGLDDVRDFLGHAVAKATGAPRGESSRPAAEAREVLADKAGTIRLVGQTPGKRYRVTVEAVEAKAEDDIPVKE